jgi:hypothetical protein
MQEMSLRTAEALCFKDKNAVIDLVEVFRQRDNLDEEAIARRSVHTDLAMVITVKEQCMKVLPKMSFCLWNQEYANDTLREVNSAVSVWNTERKQRKANESANCIDANRRRIQS